MKTFLALLISCLTLSAATTYPVLTDSTNRLFPGGVTNVFFLNSNVVTTGTMRATGALTLTNASNVFAGDGSGLTGISTGVSKTNGSATNLSVYSSGTTNMPLRVFGTNGTSQVYVDKDGVLNSLKFYIPANTTTYGIDSDGDWSLKRAGTAIASVVGGGVLINTGNSLYFRSYDPIFIAPAAGVISLVGNGNHSLRVYGTVYADESNHARASLSATTNTVVLAAETAGTGADNISINLIPAGTSGVVIGSGGAGITKVLSATATLNFDLSAVTVEDLTITVTGAADGDVVTLGVPNGSVTTSVQYSAWVSAADTVTVRARTSAAGENPASGTFRATVIKH